MTRSRVAAWSLLRHGNAAGVATLAAVTCLEALLPLASAVALGLVVGSLPEAIHRGAAGSSVLSELWLFAALPVLFWLSQVMSQLTSVVTLWVSRDVDRKVRSRTLHLASTVAEIDVVEDSTAAAQLAVLSGRSMFPSPGAAATALVQTAGRYLQAGAAVAFVAAYQPLLAGALLVVNLWMRRYALHHHAAPTRALVDELPLLARGDYQVELLTTSPAAKEVRLYGLTNWLLGRHAALYQDALARYWQLGDGIRRRLFSMYVLWAAAYISVSAFAAVAAARGEISLTLLIVVLQAAGGVGAIASLQQSDIDLEYGSVAVAALAAIESLATVAKPVGGASAPLVAAAPPLREPKVIRFENVRFAYPRGGPEVLRGLDFELRAGTTTAVVGLNGAGKTTLVRLLARLNAPTSGRIRVNEWDLGQLDVCAWRRMLSVVFQDFVHYDFSARDNVAFGYVEELENDDALRRAAERAGISSLVEALPAAWDTTLSRHYSAGTELSGGQWQRVALARALFAVECGARVLVLDEPTAHLDIAAEAALLDDLGKITVGLTTLLISHRLSSVRHADRIYVVDTGRVAETGNHASLMTANGQYADMFRAQAERFRIPGGPEPMASAMP